MDQKEIEEAANLLVEGFDRDGDEEISLNEVIDGVKVLIIQAIEVVDVDGDEKVSPDELVKATGVQFNRHLRTALTSALTCTPTQALNSKCLLNCTPARGRGRPS